MMSSLSCAQDDEASVPDKTPGAALPAAMTAEPTSLLSVGVCILLSLLSLLSLCALLSRVVLPLKNRVALRLPGTVRLISAQHAVVERCTRSRALYHAALYMALHSS